MKGAFCWNESWDIVILDAAKLKPRKKVLFIVSYLHFVTFIIKIQFPIIACIQVDSVHQKQNKKER